MPDAPSRKYLFLIADGMGDWPMQELGGRTVLGAANTPTMDAMARRGVAGLCRTIPPGMPPGSDVANMSLLGYDPAANHTGRGPIEAAAQGLALEPDDLVWRCNLVNLTALDADGIMLDYSSGHIATEAARALIDQMNASLPSLQRGDLQLIPGIQYRHLLVQKGGGHGPDARLHIRPPHDLTDKPIADDVAAYAGSAALATLLQEAAAFLAGPDNPTKARSLWPWGQGLPLHLDDFQQKTGLRGAVMSAVDLINGLGRAAGMTVLHAEGITGLLDTNYEGKVQASMDFLDSGGDFVFLHVEAPDECGHAGNIDDKIESIQRFDARVVRPLFERYGQTDAAFCIACDHLTPLARRTHVPEPVPFLLYWNDCSIRAGLNIFTEATAANTGLVIEPGHLLLDWIMRTVGDRA
ncbi:2,3-bisphosphoglycerate-independent phosphoglycerate mutase [Megalodesulfovibrio gigas]|uniref:Putative homoserine kinase n=1 Tax=Megalodesulfovibrio gigas (strain ATCC 19364 / DSM 1382 / NCIMB 9332 / VKM B-1759) TaxID=1121448 RepID=T2GDP6_MEGG1|nr:2,3-bisphosphoglycerate-independent phosphoglycerate mutase [Megalodesulfovibrio gigas]AGW14428.1 putative homoserine kinase [Megalodesulfovibrio gigas DSM 1382 = ATCC 19364]